MQKFTTPAGRLIFGSCYTPNTTDFQGNPLVYKSGVNMGQPKIEWVLGIAIPKAGEGHWAETPWGSVIWQQGHADFPNGQAQQPTFKWKISDGDSTAPDQKGVILNTKVGHAGHWVMALRGLDAPGLFKMEGANPVQCVEPDFIKSGYWVQVAADVKGNDVIGENAGVYLTPRMVCFVGYGEVITSSGGDPAAAGFGGAPLPPGASATPIGGFQPAQGVPPQGQPGAPTAPPAPAAQYAPSVPAAPAAPSAGAVPGPPPPGNYQPQ
jgi:hypothetical protein